MSSNLIEKSLPTVGGIDIVLATGCPDSGWETAIPALQAGGLKLGDDRFSSFYDQLDRSGIPAPETIPATEVPLEENLPILLADQRNIQILDFWATQLPHARFLLFYQNPETAVAHALLKGNRDPLKFLHDWQTTNRQLINFQRRHRDRAILLNAEAAGRHTQGLLDACSRIGLKLELSGQIEVLHPAIPVTERLLANHLVKQYPAIQPFQAELEARAQPFDITVQDKDQQIAVLIDEYLHETASRTEHQQQIIKATELLGTVEAERNNLVKERETLRTQLNTAREKLQNADTQNESLTEQINKLITDKQTLQKDLDQTRDIKTNHDELEKENELLLLQLHQVQEELEDYFLKYHELIQKQSTVQSAAPVVEIKEDFTQSKQMDVPESKHFLLNKLAAFFKQLNAEKEINKRRVLILESGLFDEKWYLTEYPDVAKAKADPILHYIRHGARAKRNPSPHFNTAYYLQSNPDVAESGMNPLFHYIKFGKNEGRKPA